MTHGEMWLAKAHRRIEGWCKTRGWTASFPRLTAPRAERWRGYSQYEVFITDRNGRTASIAFDMHADRPDLVDDGGLGQGFDAVTFDAIMESFDLAEKVKPSKRQLELWV
jgi:hypothetical protein